jgi:hypothetical protein
MGKGFSNSKFRECVVKFNSKTLLTYFRQGAVNGSLLQKPSNLISLGTPITFTKIRGRTVISYKLHGELCHLLIKFQVDCISSGTITQSGRTGI